jgi:hypothetical protein
VITRTRISTGDEVVDKDPDVAFAIRVEVHADVLDGAVRHASEEQDFGVRQRLARRVHDARGVRPA